MSEQLDAAAAVAWLDAFAGRFAGERARFDDLDRRSGDGDFGSNFGAALERARPQLAEAAGGPVGAVFIALGKGLMRAGGTSGPLFGTWFRMLGKEAGDQQAIGLLQLALGVRAGIEAVQRLGGAELGDKTMIDALMPAADALADAAARGSGLGDGLAEAAAAARAGAEATAGLRARRGRASYVGEAARGVVDPGAAAVALLFDAAAAS